MKTASRSESLIRTACTIALLKLGAFAHAQSTTWTNGSADSLWDTPANWSAGLPGAGNNAVFTGAAPGVVSLGGTPSGAATMDLTFSGGGYTIGSGGANGVLTLDELFHSAGTNVIEAPITSGGGANLTGGTLRLTNTSLSVPNTITGTWTIGAGSTVDAAFGGERPASAGPSGSSALGTAAINLNGGTLVFTGNNYDPAGGGLTLQTYNQHTDRNARIEFSTLGGLTALVNTSTPETLAAPNAGFTNAIAGVNFENATFGSGAIFAGIGNSTIDRQFAIWKGKFIAPADGTYRFYTRSDDGSMMYVNGQLVVSNNNFQGATDATGTIDLTAGEHDIMMGYYEGTGGSGFVAGLETGANTTFERPADIIPQTSFHAAQPFTALGNSVTLNESSAIVAKNTFGVGLGTLTANIPGKTLTTGEHGADGLVRFGSTSLGASGVFTFHTNSDLALGQLNAGSPATTITKLGAANLILDNIDVAAVTADTIFDVREGRLVAQRSNTGVNPLGTARIELNAAGTVLQLNVIETATTHVDFDNAIAVNENARIEAFNHVTNSSREVRIGSGANGISIATGKTLELTSGSQTNTRINGVISGAGDIRVTYGPDAGNGQGFILLNAANTLTGTLFLENGTSVRIDNANALNTVRYVDVASNARVEFFASNSYRDSHPPIITRPGSFFRLNNQTALNGTEFLVGPGRILEFQNTNGYTGTATVFRAPNSYLLVNSAQLIFPANTTQVGLRAADMRPLDVIRVNNTLTGAGDDILDRGWGATAPGTILQINAGDRNLTNTNVQEMNGQIIINDGSSRSMQDGNRLDINELGGTFAATNGTTLNVAENIQTTVDSGQITIGAHIPLDSAFRNGTVAFGHGSLGDFTGTAASADDAVIVIAGAALEGRANTTGNNGFGLAASPSLGVNLARGTLRAFQPTSNAAANTYSVSVAKVFATGAGTLHVNRNSTNPATVTEMRIDDPITRSPGATLGLLSQNNNLGASERIRFNSNADAPARLAGPGPSTINMVAPWIINVSANVGSFVDYDPAQDPATGPGFVNATYTTVATEDQLTPGTIADITAAGLALTEDRTVAAARIQTALGGGAFNLTSQSGGFIITSGAADNRTISANLAAPAGTELIIYSGGQTGGFHTLNGRLISDTGFTKFGPRTLQLNADSSATLFGDITINEASLVVASADNRLGAPTNRVVLNGGNLRPSFNLTTSREIVVNAGGGQLANDGNRTISYGGVISGEGALTISAVNGNNGINRFTATDPNTFAGGLIVSNGTLEFSRNDQLGATPLAGDYDRGHVVLNDANTNVALRLASGAGNVTTTGRQFTILGTSRIDVAGATDQLTIDRDIRGSGSLIKQGPGTLLLANPQGNGYTGNTTVNDGTLLVSNTSFTATGTGNVTVNSGATLGGNGFIEGAITGNTGSTLAPGLPGTSNGVGRLGLSNSLTLQDDANFRWTLAAESTSGPGLNFDIVQIDFGTVNIADGVNFVLEFAGTTTGPSDNAFWSAPQTWDNVFAITDLATSGTIGTFDVDNAAWAGLGSFSTVADANGVDLIWTPIPEPGSFGTLLGGFATLCGLRRMRRRA